MDNEKLDIAKIATSPKSAEVDGQKVSAHPLSEVIEADRYLASKKATSGKAGRGFRITKMAAGGAEC